MKSLHNEVSTEIQTDANDALARLFELVVVLGEYMEHGLAERGLTRARATVIVELYHRGSVTQRELSQALRVTPRNVTGLLDALQVDGFVARGPHPTDRRATLVSLTQRGSAVAAALQADHQTGARILFVDLPAADLASFVTTLDRVRHRLDEAASATSVRPH